jgi:hypothetical protein
MTTKQLKNAPMSTIPTTTGVIFNGIRYEPLSLEYVIHKGNCPKYQGGLCLHQVKVILNLIDGDKVLNLFDEDSFPSLIIRHPSHACNVPIKKLDEVLVDMTSYTFKLIASDITKVS